MNKRGAMENNPLFRTAVLILGVMLAFNLLSFCVRLAGESRVYGYEYMDMQRAMEDGDYPELMNMVSRNQAEGIEPRKDTSEFEAIAAYYEAASLYHAFAETKDTDRAARMRERLAEAEKGLVTAEFTEAAQKIRAQFSLDE